jgi:hypothetical protein
MATVAVLKNQEATMFKRTFFFATLLVISSAIFNTAEAKRPITFCDPTHAPGGVCVVDHQPGPDIRDHRCPASQGGNCVGPEPQVVQCLVAPCPPVYTPPPRAADCNDPRICDTFGPMTPPHRPPVVIVDPYDPSHGGFGISCRTGRNIVRQHGFRHVHVIDCSGNEYSYEGRKHGEQFEITVSVMGQIVSVDSAY